MKYLPFIRALIYLIRILLVFNVFLGEVADIIRLVTKENRPPDEKMTDWYDSEPVGWAASFGQLGALRCLIDLGAYPFTLNKAGNTALTDAEREKHKKCVKFLKEYKNKENPSHISAKSVKVRDNPAINNKLIQAAWDGDTSKLKSALDEGANIEATGGGHNGTALNAAARNGHAECIRILLKQNPPPNLNAKNIGWGHAPLHQASFFNRTECVR